MSLQIDVQALLLANSSLVAAFSGGILAFSELSGDGLTRTGTPAAFDETTKQLKPTLIVKERQENATLAVRDEAAQNSSFVQALEIWYYSASGGSYATLESAQQTVYGILHDKTISGRRLMRRERHTMERDRTLSNAVVCYDVYDTVGVWRP